ncbi:MAG TPA: hypothetical protein VGD21_01055 [Lysobacter sp.]
MRPTRAAVLATLLLAVATHGAHAEHASTRYFDLVNATHDSVTSFAVAPAGSDAFRELDLGGPLRGGLTSTTVDIAEGGCRRDFRVVFRDGRRLLYPDIDVCRYRRLRLTDKDGKPAELPPAERPKLAIP